MANSDDTFCDENNVEQMEEKNGDRNVFNAPLFYSSVESIQRNIHHRRHSLSDNTSLLNCVQSVPRNQKRRCSLQVPQKLHKSFLNAYQESNTQLQDRTIDTLEPSVVGMGSELFVAFLHEEINRSHMIAPECMNTSRLSHHRTSDSTEFLSLGAHLRFMADEFATSDHRRTVREQAENIPLESLDAGSFSDLLFGMFQQGGVTWERILVLFVFCSDLALRALREHLAVCFSNLMHWSQLYIESWLTPWVQRHGGWSVLLERSVNEAYKAAIIGACMMGMLALWTYIRSAGR